MTQKAEEFTSYLQKKHKQYEIDRDSRVQRRNRFLLDSVNKHQDATNNWYHVIF